jgi:hypothetical protein
MDVAIDVIVRTALALLLLVAAAHKLRDLAAFRRTFVEYRLAPGALAPLAPLVEGGIATALLWPAARGGALLAAAALFAAYGVAIGVNLARGRRHIDCGCVGPAARQPIGPRLVARNGVLATTAAAAAAVPVVARTLGWVDVLTIAGAVGVLAAQYAAVERMLADAPRLALLRGQT